MSAEDGRQETAGTRGARIIRNLVALLRLRWTQAQRDTNAAVRGLLVGLLLALIALIVALLAVPLLMTVLILALAQVMAVWLATVLVLVTVLIIAGVLLLVARRKLRWKAPTVVAELKADWDAIRHHLEEES